MKTLQGVSNAEILAVKKVLEGAMHLTEELKKGSPNRKVVVLALRDIRKNKVTNQKAIDKIIDDRSSAVMTTSEYYFNKKEMDEIKKIVNQEKDKKGSYSDKSKTGSPNKKAIELALRQIKKDKVTDQKAIDKIIDDKIVAVMSLSGYYFNKKEMDDIAKAAGGTKS